MPCNCDGMEEYTRRSQQSRAAELFRYALADQGRDVPEWLHAADRDRDGKGGERIVIALCDFIKSLDVERRDALVYARNPTARDLANWWEEHQAEDAKREAREREAAKMAELRQRIEAKLTPEELAFLRSDR